ncbi:MAG: MATE family efflux transporter [Lachnoclostridium sp.]|jgi:putative MATE family efflux protein
MTKINDKEEKKAFYKLVFTLVFPMALQNLINVGVTSADVIMLGQVGETALSGSSLAGQVQFIMSLIFFGLTSGAAVLTAQYWGKKDIRTIEKVLAITMRFALLVSVIFTLGALLFPAPIMRLYTSEEAVLNEGVKYLKIVGLSYIFVAATMIYLNVMRSVERVIISTVVYSISLVINVILNSIFIFGLFGFPAMGIQGAALATLIARISEFLIVWFYARKINRVVRFHFRDLFLRDKILMKDFLTYSIPVMLNELLWGAGTSANAAIIGHLGSPVVAANSVIQVIRQLAMVVAFGIANATAIIIGKTIGEQKEELAKVYAKRFIRITLIVGLIGSLVILVVSQIAQNRMTLSQDAKYYLKIMMIVMSYFALCQAYNTTMVVGVFRAGGDTKFGLILDSTTLWGCSILFGALAAFVWKLPIPVVYAIIMSDEVIKIPLSTIRYKSYKWVRNVTR